MPALLLNEANATILKDLVEKHGDEAELTELKAQLNEPLHPTQEGAIYPKGTVIDHRCLVQISKWAANRKEDFNEDLSLSILLKGAQVAIAVKPKPARVSDEVIVYLTFTDFDIRSVSGADRNFAQDPAYARAGRVR